MHLHPLFSRPFCAQGSSQRGYSNDAMRQHQGYGGNPQHGSEMYGQSRNLPRSDSLEYELSRHGTQAPARGMKDPNAAPSYQNPTHFQGPPPPPPLSLPPTCLYKLPNCYLQLTSSRRLSHRLNSGQRICRWIQATGGGNNLPVTLSKVDRFSTPLSHPPTFLFDTAHVFRDFHT
jgi:hypothetical protein